MTRPHDTDVRKDVVEAIDRAFPDGVVDMTIDFDESYLVDVYPKLKAKLSRIKGAALLYERGPDGGCGWDEESNRYRDDDDDEEFDDLSADELSSSYYLFFVGLADPRFKFKVVCDVFDEVFQDTSDVDDDFDVDDDLEEVNGIGVAGCAIGASLIAPFATITLESVTHYEDGACTYPDIEDLVFDPDVDPDSHYRDLLSGKGFQALVALRGKVTRILESLGIAVLSDEDLHKAVPWLEAGDEAFITPGVDGGDLTVKNALFFRGP